VENSITYVAMDTHKKQHKVAVVYCGTGETKEFTVKNTVKDILKMVKKIKKLSFGLLRCFRGIDTLTAITVVTEIFEFGRFESPCALMAYPGLVPSEHSSRDRRSEGSITKTGNKRVRRLLVENSWHYRHRPSISRELKKRREGQPQWAIDIADHAMSRLHRRYRKLFERGKPPNKVIVAVARELAGFIWAVLYEHESRRRRKIAYGNYGSCS